LQDDLAGIVSRQNGDTGTYGGRNVLKSVIQDKTTYKYIIKGSVLSLGYSTNGCSQGSFDYNFGNSIGLDSCYWGAYNQTMDYTFRGQNVDYASQNLQNNPTCADVGQMWDKK
jgi:hypothetical protein